jgi:hypothetical protein
LCAHFDQTAYQSEEGEKRVSEEFSWDQFKAATEEMVRSYEAVRQWVREYPGQYYSASGKAPGPEEGFVSAEARAEYRRLHAAWETAHEEWERMNKLLLVL